MRLVDSDTRRRHQYIEAAIERTRHSMALPAVAEFLGGTAVSAALLDNFVIPNMRHGELRLPRRMSDLALPIIALAVGEHADVQPADANRLTKTQRRVALDRLADWDDSPATVLALSKGIDKRVRLTMPEKVQAKVAYVVRVAELSSSAAGKNPYRGIRQLPFTILRYDASRPPGPVPVYHELFHIKQALAQPVIVHDDKRTADRLKYREELEAYGVGCAFGYALINGGYPLTEQDYADIVLAKNIDTMRKQANENRQDKFFPDGALIHRLEEVGLDLAQQA